MQCFDIQAVWTNTPHDPFCYCVTPRLRRRRSYARFNNLISYAASRGLPWRSVLSSRNLSTSKERNVKLQSQTDRIA